MIKQNFHRDTIQTTPWKNKGGQTREIARSMADAPHWRLSIADVVQDGLFSTFAGLSRILTVVRGNGLRLQIADDSHVVLPGQPFAFSGAQDCAGYLIDGPVQNFNLIYDKNAWHANVRVGNPESLSPVPEEPSEFTAMYCLIPPVSYGIGAALVEGEGVICPSGSEPVSGPAYSLALRVDLWLRS